MNAENQYLLLKDMIGIKDIKNEISNYINGCELIEIYFN